jgi:hypothetical protein
VEVTTCLNRARMSSLKCCLSRLRDSTIGTRVNRDTTSKLTITSSGPTRSAQHVNKLSGVFYVMYGASHKWTEYTCQKLGELVGRGTNVAYNRPQKHSLFMNLGESI